MGKVETHCVVCGRTIHRWPYQLRDFRPMCGKECRANANRGTTPGNFKSLVGKKFNHLTVLEKIGVQKGHTQWLCRCDCGNTTVVTTGSLKSGSTKSCGCILLQTGESHWNWKKGCTITSCGYREIPVPGEKGHHRYANEHRGIAERVLGRKLNVYEVVHHINENKLDNRPENLSVLTRSEHAMLHAAMRKGVPSHVPVVAISEIAKGNVNKGNRQ